MLGKILLAIIYPAGPLQAALNACNEVSKKPRTSAEYPAKCASYFLVDKQVSASDIVMKSLYFTFIWVHNIVLSTRKKIWCSLEGWINFIVTLYVTDSRLSLLQKPDIKHQKKLLKFKDKMTNFQQRVVRSRVSGEFILIETKPGKRCLVWKKSLPIFIVPYPYQTACRDKQ